MTVAPGAEQFPLLLDAQRGEIGFIRTSRQALAQAPFLDRRFADPQAVETRLAIDHLRSVVDTAELPAVVLHTAFCCSTLLASALDRPGRVLSLKEPDVLMQLANLRRVHEPLRRDDAAFVRWTELTLRLLGRRFAKDERVLAKPTNAAANLLPILMRFDAPVLLLYSDLRAFLVSVIKKGEAGRWFVRHLLNIFRLDGMSLNQWQERDRLSLTDLQVAALVWWTQIDNYLAALSTASKAPVATLEAGAFLADPYAALAAVNEFADLALEADAVRAAAEGPAFQRHSKFADLDYDSAQREEERLAIEAAHKDALDVTLAWVGKLRGSASALDDVLRALRHRSVLASQ